MKKFFATILALAMMFVFTTAALADCTTGANDSWHNEDPANGTSSAEVKITITALQTSDDPSKDGAAATLPVEYHVRVMWDKKDGTFDASQVMVKGSGDAGDSKAIAWDCDKLEYKVNGDMDPKNYTYSPWEGDNATTKPVCRFEVTNASTPNLDIVAKASAISGGWNDYLILDQCKLNAVAASKAYTNEVLAVENPGQSSNYGTGVVSRANEKAAWEKADNTWIGEYSFVWDYAKLATKALDNYEAVAGAQDLTETFTITINPAAKDSN